MEVFDWNVNFSKLLIMLYIAKYFIHIFTTHILNKNLKILNLKTDKNSIEKYVCIIFFSYFMLYFLIGRSILAYFIESNQKDIKYFTLFYMNYLKYD